ncbi:MAG: peptidase MA family metallohydrolase, partial [Acidobacteriota bacterium]
MKLKLALVLVLVLVLDLGRAWATTLVPVASSGRIEVACEPGLESTARELAGDADAELGKIAADLPDLPVPRTVHVQLVRDASSLASVAPAGRGAPSWAIGVAYPDLGVVSIALRRNGQVSNVSSTLRHELAHLALGAALGDRAPHWLQEGFAYQHSGEWSWDRTETLAGMAWFGGIVPLEQLDGSFPAEEAPANRAYAESYDFVGYLSRRGRWDDGADRGNRWPFRQWLKAIGQGATLDQASVKAFGKPLRALFDEWKDSLSDRYLLAPIGLIGLAVWILCALLLTIAFWRRRRINRRRLAQWDREERAADAAAARLRPVIVPPYVP